MLSMVEYVHERIKTYPQNLIGADMTMGNGYDTLFLSAYCQEVYAFDIQQAALGKTRELIGNLKHVHLILDGHQNIDRYMTSFDIGIFNFGYLPNATHHITTLLETSKIALTKAIDMMNVVLFLVVYPGHEEGLKESQWIDEYVRNLDTHQYNVSCFQMLNKKNAPYVIEIEKR